LLFFLQSGIPEHEIQKFVKGAVNYASVRSDDFGKLMLPWTEIIKQKEIAIQLNRFASASRKNRDIVAVLDQITPSILSRAFAGEL
jgi:hypothetical protein